jgi:hypothetical protein
MSEATEALPEQFNDKELGVVMHFLKAANDQRV